MRFFSGHPKLLFIFAFGALWNTFSYYGTETVLVLYLMHVFQLNRSNSYLFYGAYSAFLFALPMLGGVVADKWLGYKRAIIFGSVFNIIGNLLLFTAHRYLFSLGIATALIGSGFYSSNVSNLVGALYIDGDAKKETAYTLYYLSINLGGALAPLVYGAVIYFIGWHWIFLSNVLAIGISLLLFLANSKKLPQIALTKFIVKKSKLLLVWASILLITFLISLIFYYFSAINLVISVLFAVSIAYICIIIFKRTGKIRAHLLTLLALSFFSTFYYAAGLQVGTTITLFLQEKIHEGIISFHLPASTFSMLYCLFILLLAPAFTAFWYRLKKRNIIVNPIYKLSIGILLAAVGIAIFALAALTNFIISGILLGYVFLSAGELVLAPAIYTAISNLAPDDMKSTMMGCWLLFVALGGYLSSVLATAAHTFAEKFSPFHSMYFSMFAIIALFTFIVGLIALLTTPKFTKMMS